MLRQHYATDALDASTLLAAIFGFLPGDDERLRASVLAIADELTENGFVLRYRTDETDDGLSGKEGTFVICSFWLVSALAIIGEMQRARDLMERLVKVASPLGLYAEEFDVDTGRHLGNFPQAFSHLALVEAAGADHPGRAPGGARRMSPEQRESSAGMSDNGAGHGRHRVVIVGGGFGGYEAAHRLKRADVDVTVVDRRNHHLFQPLIYQVAAGALSAGDVAAPVRAMLKRQPNASVLMAEVTDVDVDRREVVLERGERLSYDSLIMACGARTSYFGHDEWREVSCGLKTLEDALDLRNRIFGAFEQAERDPGARDEWLTFVVVGGGPTGVEVSGQLAILARHTMKRDFRRIDPRAARVILLDAGERVVAAFTESTSAKAAKALAELGVTVREHAMVTDIDSRGVTVKIGEKTERIVSRTVVWAAGVSAEGVAEIVARGAGAGTDRAGRIEVKPDLTLPGHPEISVIGDAAKLDGSDGKPLPGLATVAIQQARHVAEAIRHGEPGASKPFKYFDKGALAVIGRGKAVCEVRGIRLSGWIAFLMYLGVHLFYLGGVGGRRLTVLITALGSVFGAREHRVMEDQLGAVERPVPTSPVGL